MRYEPSLLVYCFHSWPDVEMENVIIKDIASSVERKNLLLIFIFSSLEMALLEVFVQYAECSAISPEQYGALFLFFTSHDTLDGIASLFPHIKKAGVFNHPLFFILHGTCIGTEVCMPHVFKRDR